MRALLILLLVLVAFAVLVWSLAQERVAAPVDLGASSAGPSSESAQSSGPISAAPSEEARIAPPNDRSAVADPASEAGMRVTVTDPASVPIEGARVRTFADTAEGVRVTGADGVCVLPVSPDAGPVRMRIEADGYHHLDLSCTRRPFKVFGADLVIEPERIDVGAGTLDVVPLRWRKKS